MSALPKPNAEAVDRAAAEFGRHEKFSMWARAGIVACCVFEGRPNTKKNAEGRAVGKVSTREFAEKADVSQDTVSRALKTWKRAAAADKCTPADILTPEMAATIDLTSLADVRYSDYSEGAKDEFYAELARDQDEHPDAEELARRKAEADEEIAFLSSCEIVDDWRDASQQKIGYVLRAPDGFLVTVGYAEYGNDIPTPEQSTAFAERKKSGPLTNSAPADLPKKPVAWRAEREASKIAALVVDVEGEPDENMPSTESSALAMAQEAFILANAARERQGKAPVDFEKVLKEALNAADSEPTEEPEAVAA